MKYYLCKLLPPRPTFPQDMTPRELIDWTPFFNTWELAGRYPALGQPRRTVKGAELVGLRYVGPFDDLPVPRGIEHRVIPWEEVSAEEGTGIVHIAPGCGLEDFDLGRRHEHGRFDLL